VFFEQLSYPTCIRPFLYLGSVDTLNDHSFMSVVSSVVSVMNDPPKLSSSIQHMIIPIEDSKNHSITPYIPEVMERIKEAKSEQHSLLIHCNMGMSRSASFVLAWLMYEKHMDNQSADLNTELSWLKLERSLVSPNERFLSELKTFEEDLNLKLININRTNAHNAVVCR